MLAAIISLIRPQQWIKNLFVFLPMFFGGMLLSLQSWTSSLLAFATFCLASSSIYCLNDARDAESDRRHPEKCKRPVASGEVSENTAYIISFILGLAAISIAYFFITSIYGVIVTGVYILLNILYCYGLKQYNLLDVMIIAIGFDLRLALGGVACGIKLSPWIVVMVFLLALFLAFGKRRDDLVISRRTGKNPRKSSQGYNISFLNQTLAILGAVMLVAYVMYSLSDTTIQQFHSEYVYFTSIFVIAGLLRYLQVAMVDESSGSPTKVAYTDRFLQICVAGWIVSFLLIIYL